MKLTRRMFAALLAGLGVAKAKEVSNPHLATYPKPATIQAFEPSDIRIKVTGCFPNSNFTFDCWLEDYSGNRRELYLADLEPQQPPWPRSQ